MVQGQGQLCVDPDPFHFLGRSPLVDEVYHPKEASWIQLLDPGGLTQPYLQVQNPQVLSQLRVLVRVELKAGHYISPIFHGFGVPESIFPVAFVPPLFLCVLVFAVHSPQRLLQRLHLCTEPYSRSMVLQPHSWHSPPVACQGTAREGQQQGLWCALHKLPRMPW